MINDKRFIALSVLLCTILSSSVAYFVLSGSLRSSLSGGDVGLAALPIISFFLVLALVVAIFSYAISYILLMIIARYINKRKVQILHPRKDFVIGLVPSWILAGVLVYGLIVLSNWLYPINAVKGVSASKQAVHQTISPTPTTTLIPSTLPGDETLVHTAPVPTTIAFAPVGSVAGETTSAQQASVETSMAEINHSLQTKDHQQLYGLLSGQLTAMFSADSIGNALSGLGGDAGLQLIGDPQISGDWAKQQVSYMDNGKTSQYLVVLHLESGEWKLFGTAAVN